MAFVVLALFGCDESIGDNDDVHIDASVDHATSQEDVMGDVSRDRITEEEWERIKGPVAGTHDVDSFPSQGCPTQGIEQEFRIVPTVACAWRGTRAFRECDVEPYCQRHTDCSEAPFGRCRGSPSASCVYPDVPPAPCSSNSECTSLPGGSCSMVTEPNTPRCYPTGRCEIPERRCFYQIQLCSDDAECTSAPGGICAKRIRFARCEYQECLEDRDCTVGKRCACSSPSSLCVPADCAADTDCSAGERCLLAPGCYGAAAGYHCTTPLDACHAKEECPASDCVFDGYWHCRDKPCPIPP